MRHLTLLFTLFTIIITNTETISGVYPKHITAYLGRMSHGAIIFYIDIYRDMEAQILQTRVPTLR